MLSSRLSFQQTDRPTDRWTDGQKDTGLTKMPPICRCGAIKTNQTKLSDFGNKMFQYRSIMREKLLYGISRIYVAIKV